MEPLQTPEIEFAVITDSYSLYAANIKLMKHLDIFQMYNLNIFWRRSFFDSKNCIPIRLSEKFVV